MLILSLIVCSLALAAELTVVMIHGAGGGGWEYRFWKPVFAQAGYRVAALDLRPSAQGLAGTTFDDYVNQVAAAARGRTVLVGASMGGVLALKAAEKVKPDAIVLVCSAIPAGIAPVSSSPSYPAMVEWANGPYHATVDAMPDSDEATRRYAWKRWRHESGAVLNTIAMGVPVQKPNCPALAIIPEADDTVPPDRQQALAAWAKADTLRYEGMSHVGPLLSTRAAEVAADVAAWLRARPLN